MPAGQIIILNGTPRSGKSSIAAAIQARFDGVWMNLGVDVFKEHVTPQKFSPGIGLRPGGERPEIEALVPTLYAALYATIAAHSDLGLNVVADVGHHDGYAEPRNILADCARRLDGYPVLFVGVRCPVETIMERRRAAQTDRPDTYLAASPDEPVPAPVLLWQEMVHRPGIYDLEVDTSVLSPEQCADAIAARLRSSEPLSAFKTIARLGNA